MRRATITPPPPAGSPPNTTVPPFVLGDDAAGRGPGSMFISDLSLNISRKVQRIDPTDAVFSSFQPRGLLAVTFIFVVEYEFASADACFKFKTELPLKLPGGGLLEVTVVNGQKIFYDNAVIESAPVADIGEVSARVTYTILAGQPRLAT